MKILVNFCGLKVLNCWMNINKDTIIFGSFSLNPGNNGCEFFNEKFKENNINAIYKSFFSDDIYVSYKSAKSLRFGGFAVSMPHKLNILELADKIDINAKNIGAGNTILFNNDKSTLFNTDWIAVRDYLSDMNIEFLTILGNGGFSRAVQYACKSLEIDFNVVTRKNWSEIKNTESFIFNATPAEVNFADKKIIDGRPHTDPGKSIARLQAVKQYEIYSELF